MNKEQLLTLLQAPHLTEKSSLHTGQYVFKVRTDATKPKVKAAVEMVFNVKVKSVRTVRLKGKTRRFANRLGQRSDWKKAYVTLVAGQQIELVQEQTKINRLIGFRSKLPWR